jgi:ADP-heptose:LPS heptosyltransferase
MKILLNRKEAIGDVILTTGLVRKLSIENQAKVDVCTARPEVYANNPYVGTVFTALPNVSTYDKFFNLDLVYENNPGCHVLEAYSESMFGTRANDIKPELFPGVADLEYVKNLGLTGKYIVLHMRNHFWPSRNIDPAMWIAFAKQLLSDTDCTVVQVGTGNDLAFSREGEPRLVNLKDRLSIHQTHALINRAQVFVGADAGPLHIAACTETPVVALYTSVRAEYREPKFRSASAQHISIASNIDCYGCVEQCPAPYTQYYCKRGDEECTRRFDSDNVFDQVKNFL